MAKIEFTVTNVEHATKEGKKYTRFDVSDNIVTVNGFMKAKDEIAGLFSEGHLDVEVGSKVLLDISLARYARRDANGKYQNFQTWRLNSVEVL